MRCEGSGSSCQGGVSRTCTAGVQALTECGDGCNVATGLCNDLRPIGTGCEVSAQCASGVCARDVTGSNRCCDATCEATGRACGTAGTCVCALGQREVGAACLLENGADCVDSRDCASGACVRTIAGGNVCCASQCEGEFCSSDGAGCVECEGEAPQCAGNVSQRCQDGDLLETNCGNGCNPSTGVCTGLLGNGQSCSASAQCGSTLCAPDVSGVMRCCTPNCAASGRVCDADGACVCPNATDVFVRGQCRGPEGESCAADGDCRSDACENTQSVGQVCCTAPCNGQICRASGQGCVQCEGGAPSCQGNNSRSCVNNAFVTTTCGNGCNPATGFCNALIPIGSTGCSQSTQCAVPGSSCQGNRCCEFDCVAAGRVCASDGTCQCPAGTVAVGTACLLAEGRECDPRRAGVCATGSCLTWYRDADGDTYGNRNDVRNVCGTVGSPPPAGYVASSGDCCDSDRLTNPAQTTRQPVANGCGSFDYNCDGAITNLGQYALDRGITACDQIPVPDCNSQILWPLGIPSCGVIGRISVCDSSFQGRPTGRCGGIAGDNIVNDCL